MDTSRHFLRTLPFYSFNFLSYTALSIFFARWMGIEHYGSFAFAFHCIRMATLIASVGISQAAIKFLPRYFKRREYSLFSGFFRVGLLINICAGLLLGFAAFGLMLPVIEGSHSHLTLRHAWWICPFLGVNLFFSGVLRSVGYATAATASQGFLRDVLALGAAYLYYFDSRELSSEAGIVILAVSLALCIAIQLLIQLSVLSGEVRAATPVYDVRRWTMTSMPMLLSSLSVNPVTVGGIILLRLIHDETAVAFYHAAWTLSAILAIPVKGVLATVGPVLSSNYGEDQRAYEGARRLGGRLLVLSTLPLCLLLLGGGSSFLEWFGKVYTAAYGLLVVLVFARGSHVAVVYLGRVLSLSGHEIFVAKTLNLSIVASLPAMILLAHAYGPYGVATAYLLTTLIQAGALGLRLRSAG